MCTLTIAWQTFDEAPVVVAANRDEAFDRPSDPPARIDRDGVPVVVAPTDREAGGTWVGYNGAGVFVGITNRWVDVDGGGERSRGLLVRDALGCRTAAEAARLVESALREHRYEAFNLVVADADAALLLEWAGHLRVRPLDPGVHVLVNVGVDGEFYEPERRPELGAEQAANARSLREALWPAESAVSASASAPASAAAWAERAGTALGDHAYGVCIHSDRFGTRSSSLLTLFADGRATYRFADGPPCETPYRDVEDRVRTSLGSDADESQV